MSFKKNCKNTDAAIRSVLDQMQRTKNPREIKKLERVYSYLRCVRSLFEAIEHLKEVNVNFDININQHIEW